MKLAFPLLALLAAAAPAHATAPASPARAAGLQGADRVGGLVVVQPWSRPAAAGSTGVGYVTLINGGKAPMVLTGVESPAAAKVTIHASTMVDGVMRMSAEDRVAIAPGATAVFGPGGRHLMLMGLKRALKPGDRVPATLSFASGRTVKIEFAVGNGLGPPEMSHKRP